MEPIRERLEALERQNRFWRGIVGVLILGSLLLLPLQQGQTQTSPRDLLL